MLVASLGTKHAKPFGPELQVKQMLDTQPQLHVVENEMKLIVLLFPLILSGCSSPGNSDVKGTPASTPDVAERKIVTKKEDKFCYVHYYLDAKPDWKIRNSEDARGVLIGGFKELGAKGISAYWGWRIRDATVAPVEDVDVEDHGQCDKLGRIPSTT